MSMQKLKKVCFRKLQRYPIFYPQNTSPALRINEGHKLAKFYYATTASCGVSVVQYYFAFYKRLWVLSGGSGSLGEPYIYTSLMKKVLHITQRKRKSNVQHYGKSDDFRAGFEVAKWGRFCHSAWLQISPARFKQV